MNEESLFAAALEKSSASERQAFLEEECGGDVRLRHRLEKLLASCENTGGILDRVPELDDVLENSSDSLWLAVNQVFAGRFKLRQKLGDRVLGPVIPNIARIRSYFGQNIMLKLEKIV